MATKITISIVLLTILPVAILTSQTSSRPSFAGSDGDNLVVQLVTASPGDELYTWWGHSAIIIEDTATGESKLYNYGLFSFDQENFYANFAQGRLLFEVGAYPTDPAMKVYKIRDRTVHIQTLDIRPERKRSLADYLESRIRPENRQYLYDHYYDNCSTRVRDVIDRFTGGALREATQVSAHTTFREQTRRFTERSFPVDLVLMYLMSDVIDVDMTVWETMFLPGALEREVAKLSVRNERGETVPLVEELQVWYEAENREPVPEAAPPLWPKSLAVGGVIGLLLAVSLVLLFKRVAVGGVFFGIVTALTGVVAGLSGTLLLLMSLFTDHVVTYGNENLILTNPLTLAFIPLGILAATERKRGARVLFAFASLHLAALIVLVMLKLVFPAVFDQANLPVLTLFAPIFVAIVLNSLVAVKIR